MVTSPLTYEQQISHYLDLVIINKWLEYLMHPKTPTRSSQERPQKHFHKPFQLEVPGTFGPSLRLCALRHVCRNCSICGTSRHDAICVKSIGSITWHGKLTHFTPFADLNMYEHDIHLNQYIKIKLLQAFGSDYMTVLPVKKIKEWHKLMILADRKRYIYLLLDELFTNPVLDPQPLSFKGFQKIAGYARALEVKMYEKVNSKAEYYLSLSNNLDVIRETIRQRNMQILKGRTIWLHA